MKVLHLTNWYPSSVDPIYGNFIKEQIDNIDQSVLQSIVHLEVKKSNYLYELEFNKLSSSESSLILKSKFFEGRLSDYLTLLLLIITRIRMGRKWWDIINIHIAIPLFRFPKITRFLFGKNIIISEHWSAYHYNFYLPDDSPGKQRLGNIFKHGHPIITVSNALSDDIRNFSNCSSFPNFVIPNIIRPETFNYKPRSSSESSSTTNFLIAASWRSIKQPFLILESFNRLLQDGYDVSLRIIGEGDQLPEMKKFVSDNEIIDRVTFLGRCTKPEIAHEMQMADCFLHASKYETFSIVCAEAIFCGTPVIASSIPAIRDFIDHSNGLFSENTIQDWHEALKKYMSIKDSFDRKNISKRAIERFHPDRVRDQVLEAYRWTIERNNSESR